MTDVALVFTEMRTRAERASWTNVNGRKPGACSTVLVLCRDSVILIMETGYVFGWLIAMILDNVLPMEAGDPIERARAAKKARGVLVPLPSDAQQMLQEQQLANPKMSFTSDSAHPEANIVPVSQVPIDNSCNTSIAVQICPLRWVPFTWFAVTQL